MPLYSYHCAACGENSELLMGSDEIPFCPFCDGEQMERLPSLVAPEPKSKGLVQSARTRAAREGHFSNYSKSELKR